MSLFLLTFLTACGTNPRPVPISPPVALMQDCNETQTALDAYLEAAEADQALLQVPTNGDLVRKIRALRVDLRVCNADKAGLRQWVAEMVPK